MHKHAAASVCRVPRYCAILHDEDAKAIHIHAAASTAVSINTATGNGAAAHFKSGVGADIHAAALACIVACNRAAAHGEGAAIHIHAAAVRIVIEPRARAAGDYARIVGVAYVVSFNGVFNACVAVLAVTQREVGAVVYRYNRAAARHTQNIPIQIEGDIFAAFNFERG